MSETTTAFAVDSDKDGIPPLTIENHSANSFPLGAPHPEDSTQVCVKCGSCSNHRWVKINVYGAATLESHGWLFRCVSCAARDTQLRRTAALPDVLLPTNSIVRPSRKNPNNQNEEEVICGICGATHFEYRRPRHNAKDEFRVTQKGFCENCWPWARIALRPEHDSGASAERDAIYSKIRDIRYVLESGVKPASNGVRMPFCVLAKRWEYLNQKDNAATRDTQAYNVKLLSFYFGTTPIGEITLETGMEFKNFLLRLPPTRGAERGSKRSELSVNQTLGVLRRIFSYASEQRWIKGNPFPIGGEFTPSRRIRKPTPLITVNEESRLLAACTGDLAYLREIIICLIDTGMHESDRQKLRWSDMDLGAMCIKGSGCPMKMTPRLHAAMRGLWDRSDQIPSGFVWGSKNIKRGLGRARLAGQIEGLHINYFRPTAAWRMAQAGIGFEQIAAELGCKDFNYLRQYLETDPEAAQCEISSPLFKQFISEQFDVLVNRNDGQQNGSAEKKQHGGARNTVWTPDSRAELLKDYEEMYQKIKKKSDDLPDEVKDQMKLRGNKPSDLALRCAAKRLKVKCGEYLRRVVLPQARLERT